MVYSHNRILLSNKKEQVIGTWINLQSKQRRKSYRRVCIVQFHRHKGLEQANLIYTGNK